MAEISINDIVFRTEDYTWYHGTRRQFHIGETVLPRSEHKGPHNRSHNPDLPDEEAGWVYFTPTPRYAEAFAYYAPGDGEPHLVVLDPDPDTLEWDPYISPYVTWRGWRAKSAKVLHVLPNLDVLYDD